MGLFRENAGKELKPKKVTDWIKVGGLGFFASTIGIIFAGKYVEGFPLGIKTFIFLVLIAVGLYVGLKFLRFASPTKTLSIEDAGLYIAVLAGIVWMITKFDISPSFIVVASNIMSVVGLG